MGFPYWLKRWVQAFVAAFVVIAGVQFFKTQDAMYALEQGALWAFVTATVFVASAIYRFRKSQPCLLCDDIALKAKMNETVK